jgi:hypothetical protein
MKYYSKPNKIIVPKNKSKVVTPHLAATQLTPLPLETKPSLDRVINVFRSRYCFTRPKFPPAPRSLNLK